MECDEREREGGVREESENREVGIEKRGDMKEGSGKGKEKGEKERER